MSTFTELHLDDRILEALDGEGYRTPTPVQAETIPALMDGRDVLGIAQTGTGKPQPLLYPFSIISPPRNPPRADPFVPSCSHRPVSWLHKSVSACASMAAIYRCIPPSFSVA